MMKLKLPAFWILTAVMLFSCRKTTDGQQQTGYIKSIQSDIDVVTVGAVLLPDNSNIVVCRSQDETTPGYMYKINSNGDLIWKKQLHKENVGCYQVYDINGNGFVVVGYESKADKYYQIFKYDDDGQFVSSRKIYFNLYWYSVTYFTSIQMFELSNGNFVFAYNEGDLILNFTNSSFDTLYRSKIKVGKYTGAYVRGIYQNTDSTILFANTVGNVDPFNMPDMDLDLQMVQTDLKGKLISNTIIGDSNTNEAPNVLLPLGNRMLLITARMGPFNQGNGTVVNYLNNWYTKQISGNINLVELTGDGQFEARRSIKNYPANGMIMNARPTADGGYILCGTVGQSDMVNMVSPTKIHLVKLNSRGHFEWSKTYSTTYPSYGIDVHQTADGGYFVSGYEYTFDKKYNVLVLKTDKNGDL